MRLPIVVFLSLGVLLAGQAKADPIHDQLIITNVNVVDVRTEQVGRNLTVVVKNGRIDSVAKVALIGSGRDLHVVNGNGKYLIPGLWDMHVHTAGGSAPAWDDRIVYPLEIANGVTGVRDMGGDTSLLLQRRQRIAKGDLLGPHIVMAGPFLSRGKTDEQTIAVNSPAEARQAVDAVKKQGLDFVKILSVSREAYLAIAEEAQKQHIHFVGHVPDSVSVAEASAAGQRSIEHLSGFFMACSAKEAELRQLQQQARAEHDGTKYYAAEMQAMRSYSSDKAYGLFIQLVDNNTWQVPTLIWDQADSHVDDPETTADSRLKYVPASVRAQWDPAKVLKNTSPERLSDTKQEAERYVELAGVMRRAGVLFMAGSDGPDPYVYPGFSLHDELELLVKAGFSPAQALQAATFNPALFMGTLDRYGTVEKGRVADLVLLDANPLEDIRNTRKIDSVILGGKVYSREDLNHILADVEQLAARE
jgi:imidazolonepropionase-like amidohydrolase